MKKTGIQWDKTIADKYYLIPKTYNLDNLINIFFLFQYLCWTLMVTMRVVWVRRVGVWTWTLPWNPSMGLFVGIGSPTRDMAEYHLRWLSLFKSNWMSVCVWRRITPSAEPFLVKFLIGVGKVYTKFWLGYYNLIRKIAPPPSPLKKCPFFKNLNLKWRPDFPSPPFMCS